MNIKETSLGGVKIAETVRGLDSRGSFGRFFCQRELSDALQGRNIVQINHSLSHMVGSIRGMHFQRPPFAEMKLVRCLKGAVFDVAIDLRENSPSFLRWHGELLTENNGKMLIIPEGFAHGFQVLEANSELLYLHTQFYNAAYEGGIKNDDPAVGINWPLAVTEISIKDQNHTFVGKNFEALKI